eukprot:CAMPEP_0170178198 /NCGR_PEP_ID=MMETSP0040_2-20121228/11730_1 /TAXON_ID=641309 /ORGANISM="Lotharella oceanica, Strain CCMP622" /LENGTH=142 /DNA_ID=CAMNT_0010421191 /DNA_START=137 /DNA_END=565 /DNA_ORIENTATION=+
MQKALGQIGIRRIQPSRCSEDGPGGVLTAEEAGILSITPSAVTRISEIKASKDTEDIFFRMGVKAGGCSGFSYTMNMVGTEDITGDDTVVQYDGFSCVIDPQSLLYLFGMTLDFSDELIGGGFKFSNPNAKDTCGCGSSFGV